MTTGPNEQALTRLTDMVRSPETREILTRELGIHIGRLSLDALQNPDDQDTKLAHNTMARLNDLLSEIPNPDS